MCCAPFNFLYHYHHHHHHHFSCCFLSPTNLIIIMAACCNIYPSTHPQTYTQKNGGHPDRSIDWPIDDKTKPPSNQMLSLCGPVCSFWLLVYYSHTYREYQEATKNLIKTKNKKITNHRQSNKQQQNWHFYN